MVRKGKREKDIKGIFLAYASGRMVVLFTVIGKTVVGVVKGNYEFGLGQVEKISGR